MTENDFTAIAASIAKLNGVSEDTAAGWLSIIGDTPEFEADGRVALYDENGSRTGSILWPAED